MPNGYDEGPNDNGPPTDDSAGDECGKRRRIDRRSYLKAASAAVAAPVAAAATASAATTRHGISFDRVLDAVDDLGCDPTGTEPCQAALAGAAADDTLVTVPEGTYRIDGTLSISGVRNFGIAGEGGVTFEIPADTQVWAVDYDHVTNALFEGVTIDQTATDAIGRTRFGCSGGRLHVEDVTVSGVTEPIHGEAKFRIVPFAREPDATVVVKEFAAPDGGKPGSYAAGGGGVYAGGAHVGTLRLVDCHVEGHPNNGAYVSRTNGAVRIEGGRYANNGVSQVRLSGPDSAVDGATLVADHDGWSSDLGSPDDANNTRLVWWEATDADETGGEVRNCRLAALRWDGDPMAGAVAVDGNAGALTVRDTAIRCDVDTQAVRAESPAEGSRRPPTPHGFRLVDSRVTGAAAGSAAVLVRDRPGTAIRNSCVHGSGDDRDGIELVGCDGAAVSDTTVDVTGEPLVVRDAGVETTGVTTDSDCSHGTAAPVALAENDG